MTSRVDLINVGSNLKFLSSRWKQDYSYDVSSDYSVNSNVYIEYDFKNSNLLLADSGPYVKNLINYGGTYVSNSNMNCLYLTNSNYTVFPDNNWLLNSNLTLATWFNTEGFQDGDEIFDFSSQNIEHPATFPYVRPIQVNNNEYYVAFQAGTVATSNITFAKTTKCDILVVGGGGGNGGGSGGGEGMGNSTNNSVGAASQTNTYFNGIANVPGGYNGSKGYYLGGATIWMSGGGGGAGGNTGTIDGGPGIQNNITGVNQWYAAGGGAGVLDNINYTTFAKGGRGGSGIGGDGNFIRGDTTNTNYYVQESKHDGLNGTGSGGGGGAFNYQSTLRLNNGGAGGSGIVIIRYTIDTPSIYNNSFFNSSNNLMTWYKFDGNSTDMLLDSSGNGYIATNNGSCTFDTSNYRTGNGSVNMNGSAQWISMNNSINPYTIWNSGGGGISFSIWFNIDRSTTNNSRIFSFGDGTIGGTSANSVFVAYVTTNNTLYFESRISSTIVSHTTTTVYNFGIWHHLVLSISTNGTWSAYINNVPISITGIVSKTIPNGVTWTKRYIGRSEFNAALYTIGNFDDFRIYNKVLSAAEVNALYNVGYNIVLRRANNRLSFQLNNISVYNVPYVDNSWNHILWNMESAYIRINNGSKNYYSKILPNINRYPPASLASATGTNTLLSLSLSGLPYGNGTYVISASSQSGAVANYGVPLAFNKQSPTGEEFWATTSSLYNTTTSLYVGTVSTTYNGNLTYLGEWLQIQLPQSIVLTYYTLVGQVSATIGVESRSPKNFIIVGSNNGIDWFLIDSRISITGWTNTYMLRTFTINNPRNAYMYYRICVNAIQGSNATYGNLLALSEWELFGYTAPFNYSFLNMLGSSTNKGNLLLSDFRVMNTSNLTDTEETTVFSQNQQYHYYVDHRFNSQSSLLTDSSIYNRTLTNNGGVYNLNENRNSILLAPGTDATVAAGSWGSSNDFTIAGWYKTSTFYNGDKILDFYNIPYTQIKYPKYAATSTTYTYSDGSGTQVRIAASSTSYSVTHAAFDNVTNVGWVDGGNYGAEGLANRTLRTGYAGEYLQIDLGESIILNSYTIYNTATTTTANGAAKTFRIYASSDQNCWTDINHASWVLIDEKTDLAYSGVRSFNINNNTTSYRFYVIIVKNNYGNEGWVQISEWELYTNIAGATRNISIKNALNNNIPNLSFEVDNIPVYQLPFNLDNTWNHIVWNIKDSTSPTQGFVSINGVKTSFPISYTIASASYTNKLGSVSNKGSLYISDFKILTSYMRSEIFKSLYNFNPYVKNNYLQTYTNALKVYNKTSQINEYVHYEFKSQPLLTADSSTNNRILSNNGGVYTLDTNRNSLLLKNGTEAIIPTDNWSNYNNLSISTWFKTSGFQYGDKLLEFSYARNDVPTLTIPAGTTPVYISGTNDFYLSYTSVSSNTLTLTTNYICDILVIGGGGAGGPSVGGGGGAGGVVYQKNVPLNAGSYRIIVGGGGAATTTSGPIYSNGSDSRILYTNGTSFQWNNVNFLGLGGGGGGTRIADPTGNMDGGWSGGSGGGASVTGDGILSNPGNATQTNTLLGKPGGYTGGILGSENVGWIAGGGGGAGGPGGAGNGGVGVQIDITGENKWYAAGGAAGVISDTFSFYGGSGIGGDGKRSSSTLYTPSRLAGTANTGSGGGGGAYDYSWIGQPDGHGGGAGGSGIVVIRFKYNETVYGLKVAETLNNQYTFSYNDSNIYTTSNIRDGTWNHILWNIVNNGTPNGFIRFNNGDKIYVNNNTLFSSNYTNRLGSIANSGDLYLSDFRIMTSPLTTDMEARLYYTGPESLNIVDEQYVANTVRDANCLYYNNTKRIEAVNSGISVYGNLTATSDIVPSYSDIRLKDIVSGIENPLEKLMKIRTFKYVPNNLAKSLNINDGKVKVGVAAQDVKEVLPEVVCLAPFDTSNINTSTEGKGSELVSISSSNYMSVSYERIVPLLVECVKELKKEITEYKQKS